MPLTTVQSIFNRMFPYLKLEFFKSAHKPRSGNPRDAQVKPNGTLHTKKDAGQHSEITIDELMSVTSLETLFREVFGLNVQVFRMSGRSWLETTLTDDWSLKKQNDEGHDLTSFRNCYK